MHRDHYVVGGPDWARRNQLFTPLVHSAPRPRPMAVRRRVPQRELERLKGRWFALGSLATSGALGLVYLLLHAAVRS